MKVFEIGEFGKGAWKLAERPEPRPGRQEVLIKVKAASLNYRDILIAKGLYNPRLPLPRVPLSDGAGEVVEVGEGVTRVKKGERVAGIFVQKWLGGELTHEKIKSALGGEIDGMLAEYVVLHEDGVVPVPEHLTYDEAATFPCAGVTAWHAVIEYGLKPGQTVLVLGTGGVSLFALQFATLAGARVIATSSSDEKLERARQLGASDGINYKSTPDWDKRVRELTGGVGVDCVVEVGGAGTLPKSIQATRVGGKIIMIGVLAGGGEVNPLPAVMRQMRLQGIFVGSRAMYEDMNRAVAFHTLKPVIDRVFTFDQAAEALQYMESGAHFGKIVIRFQG